MLVLLRLGLILASLRLLYKKVDAAMSSISQSLEDIRTSLTEAGTEIAEKLDSLDVVSDADKAVVADIQERARALADIVPNDVPAEQPVDEDPVEEEPSAFDEA